MKKKIYNWLNNIWIGICKIYIQMVNEKALGTFLIVLAIVSSSVWGFYLVGFISWGTSLSKWCFSIGSVVWAWWMFGPASPFTLICIAITLFTVKIRKKIKEKHNVKVSQ